MGKKNLHNVCLEFACKGKCKTVLHLQFEKQHVLRSNTFITNYVKIANEIRDEDHAGDAEVEVVGEHKTFSHSCRRLYQYNEDDF